MTQDQHKLPAPALVIGTKLLPYEERFFRSGEDLARALGYTEDLTSYYSEAQVRELLSAHLQQRPLPVRDSADLIAAAEGYSELNGDEPIPGNEARCQIMNAFFAGSRFASPSLPVREEPVAWLDSFGEPHRRKEDAWDGDPGSAEPRPLYASPSVQNMGEGETGKDGVDVPAPPSMTEADMLTIADRHGQRWKAPDEEGISFEKIAFFDFCTDVLRAYGVKGRTLYDQRTAIDDACRDAAPQLYAALRNLLDAVRERRDNCGIESVVIADATAALATAGVDACEAPGIPATWQHGAGAYAQCSFCLRYTRNPDALSKSTFRCDCGSAEGWSGSFKPPGPGARWLAADGAGGTHGR